MRLTDLNPKLWSAGAGRQGIGIHFDCPGPCCAGKPEKYTLLIPFENPIDGGPPDPDFKNHWKRTGESFETMTLHPSVDASHKGHWHGWVTNGEAR